MKTRVWLTVCAVMLAAGSMAVQAQDSFGGAPRQAPAPQKNPPQQNSAPQQPARPATPAAPNAAPAKNMDQSMTSERQDFGVAPTSQLHDGAMHGPTPSSIPGGQVITTRGVRDLVQGRQAPYLLFDVLGGPDTLPGAIAAVWMSQPGSFSDQTQQRFAQSMQQGTQGRKDAALVFYCLSDHCWMSYNAALRAIKAGYTNVLWYRGGIEAWKAAGLPTQPAQSQGFQQQ